MPFELSQEQQEFKRFVREWAEEHLAPHAAMREKTASFPREAFKKAACSDLCGIFLPKGMGGRGFGVVEGAVFSEEIARQDLGFALSMNVHNGVTNIIATFGSESLRNSYVGPLIRGEILGAICLTEPGAGSSLSELKTTGKLEGEEYVLNGAKAWVTNSAEADIFLVAFRSPGTLGGEGVGMLLVDKNTPGVKVAPKLHLIGGNSMPIGEVEFNNVRIPVENLVFPEGEGFRGALTGIDVARVQVATAGVGLASAAIEVALNYVKGRKQFGSRVADQQGIQWMLAEMATEVEAARLLAYRAAYLKDQGLRAGQEAAMAKLFGSEMCVRVTAKCSELLGANGCSDEYPAERFMRQSRLTVTTDGTSQIQKTVIARSLLKN